MVSRNRRTVLASVGGALVPLAVCLGTDGTGTPSTDSTPSDVSATDEALRFDPGSLSLGVTNVQKLVIADRGPWADLKTGGGQYVVLDLVKPDGSSLMDAYGFEYELPLAVELDGTRFGPDAVPVVDVEHPATQRIRNPSTITWWGCRLRRAKSMQGRSFGWDLRRTSGGNFPRKCSLTYPMPRASRSEPSSHDPRMQADSNST